MVRAHPVPVLKMREMTLLFTIMKNYFFPWRGAGRSLEKSRPPVRWRAPGEDNRLGGDTRRRIRLLRALAPRKLGRWKRVGVGRLSAVRPTLGWRARGLAAYYS